MIRAFLLLVLATGCAADKMAAMPGDFEDCAGNSATLSFVVAPETVARGADVTLSVRWQVSRTLNEPIATFQIGEGPVVEVDVPLQLDPDNGFQYAYEGELVNPFGLGAPAGTVGVLGAATPSSGCLTSPTAATAFELE